MNVKTLENLQPITVAVDPGSKKEGFTIKSEAHTYLNIQADAITWVKDHVETRRMMRRNRRYRKTPCRQSRFNRKRNCALVPSTKARWQWKLRILNYIKKLFPITNMGVEDIKAKTKGQPRWDKSFSPLQIGKNWFYSFLENLTLFKGTETAQLRESLGLTKTKDKLSKSFNAHCVDSWVMANSIVGGHTKPDNTDVVYMKPLRFHRRQLHMLQPSEGGERKNYGSTMSMGLKRGSLVKHKKYGVTYVGGTSKGRISLHDVKTGKRLTQKAKVEDCKFLTYNSWIFSKLCGTLLKKIQRGILNHLLRSGFGIMFFQLL